MKQLFSLILLIACIAVVCSRKIPCDGCKNGKEVEDSQIKEQLRSALSAGAFAKVEKIEKVSVKDSEYSVDYSFKGNHKCTAIWKVDSKGQRDKNGDVIIGCD